jgi:hypothetical protein
MLLANVLRGLVVSVVVVGAVGCNLRKEDTDEPSDGEQVTGEDEALVEQSLAMEASSQQATALGSIPSLAMANAGPDEDPVAIQDRAVAHFEPAGCLTVSREANVVTYTFDGCTGPWGLVELRGKEIATFHPAAQGTIDVSLASEDLSLTDTRTDEVVAVEHAADVVITKGEDGAGSMVWRGGFTATNEAGKALTHTSDITASIDAEGCRTVDGTTRNSGERGGITTTFDGLTRCSSPGECPAGTVSAVADGGATFSIEFDGSDVAIYTGPAGREWEIPLACFPMD